MYRARASRALDEVAAILTDRLTLNPRDALGVVPAVQEPLQPGGIRALISCAELREVGTEQPLQRVGAPLAVCAGRRRIQREGQLVCHKSRKRLKETAACCSRVTELVAPSSRSSIGRT